MRLFGGVATLGGRRCAPSSASPRPCRANRREQWSYRASKLAARSPPICTAPCIAKSNTRNHNRSTICARNAVSCPDLALHASSTIVGEIHCEMNSAQIALFWVQTSRLSAASAHSAALRQYRTVRSNVIGRYEFEFVGLYARSVPDAA
eukprot:2654016-Rhodomonas_salina.1